MKMWGGRVKKWEGSNKDRLEKIAQKSKKNIQEKSIVHGIKCCREFRR